MSANQRGSAGQRTLLGLRTVLSVLAPILLVAVFARSGELRPALVIMANASALWLATGLLLQAGFAVNQGAVYRAVFGLLDEAVPLSVALRLALAMAFGSLASPAGTASGVAYFVAAANARGIRAGRALLTSLGYYLFDYVALLPVFAAGIAVIATELRPHGITWIVPAVLSGLVIGAVLLRRRLPALLKRLASPWRDARAALLRIRQRPGDLLRPLGHAALGQLLGLATLAAAFRAVGFHPGLHALAAAYAAANLLMVVSITPSGIGVVEPAMTAVLVSLSVPLAVAAAATVIYRALTFWVPLLAGFASLHLGRTKQMRPASS